MTKTFARNAVINENFTEVPNLVTLFRNSADMSRTYQVNRGIDNTAFGGSTSTISQENRNGGASTTHLYEVEQEDEDEKTSKLSRFLGIAFLFGLVLISITFLTLAIFYDEILDNDNETAEEYWDRIRNEIKIIQNQSKLELYNKTLKDSNFVSILSQPKPNPNSKPGITFDHFINGNFTPKTFEGKWISSNELLHYDNESNLCIIDVNLNQTNILIPRKTIIQYSLSGLLLSSDRKYLLSLHNERRVYRYSSIAIYVVFSIEQSVLLPPLAPINSAKETHLHYAEWGPTGSQIIFVYRNDIYYKSDVNSVPIRLTKTGKELVIYNGVPDWVYEEEIICGPKTLWFSPDGKSLVYSTINDTVVDIMTWPFYGVREGINGNYNQYTKIQSVRYPKPGRPNPTVTLHFVSLFQLSVRNGTEDLNADQMTVPLSPSKEILDFGEHYFTAIQWIDINWFAINWMNRAQNFSVLTLYSKINNFQPIANFRIQSSNGWIDFFTPPLIAPDASAYFVKVPKLSDNNKEIFNHIARVFVTSAKSEFLTSGVFEVKKILDINSQTQRIYFTATLPESPGSQHLLSVSLNQSVVKSEPICHTCLINTYTTDKDKTCLNSDIRFSIGAQYYIIDCFGPNIPHSEIRKTSDHSLVYTLEENEELKKNLKGLSLPKRIMMKVPVNDYEIDVMLLVPQYFDENSTQKYPILFNVYGGPGSDSGSVNPRYFFSDFSAFLVSNRSVIYAFLDARGSPNHGIKFMYDIYRKIGSVEVEDTLAVAKYLKNKPFVDSKAISIWGWSYGGYLTTMALERDINNTVFNCGVAVAPVSDWLYYDSVYVERYMGFPTPDDNLANYLRSSTLDKVMYLNGKQYLIMFGTADDNVHAMNSMMILKAMNDANIKYQTQIYPDNNHGLQNSLLHVYRRMIDFLDKCYRHQT